MSGYFLVLFSAVLAGSALAQTDDAKKGVEAPASKPRVEVSRPGTIQFGGFWLGGGGAYANGRDPSPVSRFYRPCCWHDPWYDVFSPVGVYENCYAFPGQCGSYRDDGVAEPGVMSLKAQPDAEVFIDGGYAGSAGELGDPAPGSTPEDRKVMETELSDKELPQGEQRKSVSGYLYFPKPDGKARDFQFELETSTGVVTLPLTP